MAETHQERPANNPPPPPKKRQRVPVITFLLDVLLKGLSIAIFSGFISLLIEFGMFFYSDTPVEDSYARFQSIAQFKESGSWINEKRLINNLQQTVIADFGASERINELRQYTDKYSKVFIPKAGTNKYIAIIEEACYRAIKATPEILSVWLIATFTWCAKMLGIIAMLLPVLLIVVGGFVDGSVQRKINTYRGIRDSQDKIEWWFMAFKFSTITVLFLYIAIPNSFEAGSIMLPSAIMSAFFCRNVVAHYKKYF